MPTYQYRCTECGHDLEAVQKFSDSTLTVCPNCGGSLRKIFNAVGVVFKGSGFYRTDSRANGNADANGSSDRAKSDAGSSNGKSDSASSDGKGSHANGSPGDQGSKPAKEKATSAAAPSTSSTGSKGSST